MSDTWQREMTADQLRIAELEADNARLRAALPTERTCPECGGKTRPIRMMEHNKGCRLGSRQFFPIEDDLRAAEE